MVYWPVTRDKTGIFLRFKERVATMSEREFKEAYAETAALIDRPTDLGKHSFARLKNEMSGMDVLEVGTGRGTLARALAGRNRVTACDIIPPSVGGTDIDGVRWVAANAESLPFADRSFDAVVCTHTLEHVRGFENAMSELRRVVRKELHIIVPMQRPYRVTPDLHINFFPYTHDFLMRIRPINGDFYTSVLDGDLYYRELRAEGR